MSKAICIFVYITTTSVTLAMIELKLLPVYGINMNGFHRFQKLYVMQKYIYSSTILKEREGGKEHVSVIMTSDP